MSLVDYTDLEKEIDEAPAPKVLPAGTEVTARIVAVNTGISDKNGAKWFMPAFDVPDDPMVESFNDFFWDLADRDKLTAKDIQRGLHKFNIFRQAFDIDISRPFSWVDDLPGKTGDLIVGKKKSEEYGDQNTVKKYVAGPPSRSPVDDDIPF